MLSGANSEVSSDLPEGLSEAFRMRIHNRRAGVIVQVQIVSVTEQMGALIEALCPLPACNVIIHAWPHLLCGPPGPVTAYFLIDNKFTPRSQPAQARPCVSWGMQEEYFLWLQLDSHSHHIKFPEIRSCRFWDSSPTLLVDGVFFFFF